MRKYVIFITVMLLLLSLSGCGADEQEGAKPIAESTKSPTKAPKKEDTKPTKPPEKEVKEKKPEIIDKIKVADYLLLVVQNKSKEAIEANFDVTFNKGDEAVLVQPANEYCISSGDTSLVEVWTENTKYDKYDIDGEYNTTFYKNYPLNKNISYKQKSKKADKVILSITNKGDQAVEFLRVQVLFYKGKKVVGYNSNYCMDMDDQLKPGKTKNVDIESGYDQNYKPIKFDSYKVFYSGRVME